MADEAQDPPGVTILVRIHTGNIDVAAGLIPVEELAASLKRAGITHLQCTEVHGRRVEDGNFYQELEYAAAVVEGGENLS